MQTRERLALAVLTAVAAACGEDNRNVAAGLVAPQVIAMARYLDVNMNGVVDAGDQVVVPFDRGIDVSVDATGDAFRLGVVGDSLGVGATVAHGPSRSDATITLGVGPILRISGAFVPGTVAPGSSSGIDVAGDVDGMIEDDDTRIDADRTEHIDIVGGLVDSGQRLGGLTSLAVVAGDVDGDSDLDLVFGNSNGAELWLNDGDGSFSLSVQDLGAGVVRTVVLADLDGDDDLDLALGTAGIGNRIYLNNGSGAFTDTAQSLGTDNTWDLVAADVDGDLDLDLVAANGTVAAPNRLWLNDGGAEFTDAGVPLGNGDTRAILAFDMDGDDDVDIVEFNFGPADRVWRNDGALAFADTQQDISLSLSNAAAAADLDGDGDLDFVEGNGDALSQQRSGIWINNGNGVFTAGQQFALTATTDVVLADFDGDGDVDFLEVKALTPTSLFLRRDDNSYLNMRQEIVTDSAQGAAAGDFNGDGVLDVAFAIGNSQPNQVWFGSSIN